jgi:hypothetical protein
MSCAAFVTVVKSFHYTETQPRSPHYTAHGKCNIVRGCNGA